MITSAGTPTRNTATAAATANAQATLPGGAMGKDQFMKLLIAQMQNQDPMNPMQGDQMAAQLAQFSSLEQLQQINENLTGQTASQGALLGAIQSTAAINTIGHTVLATGDQLHVGGANATTSVTADVSSPGATATLRIYDAGGKEVGSRDLGAVSAGRQTFDVGKAADGLADGNYTYKIDVKNAAGDPVTVQTYMRGRVDGVSSSPTGLVLNVGGFAIPYAGVIQVLN
jgi:flagellar basal-body rod modification protein FlgD